MATPCSNCVYKGTKYCGIFCGRSRLWFFLALLLFFAVSSWAGCDCFRNPATGQCSYYSVNVAGDYFSDCSASCTDYPSCPSTYQYNGRVYYSVSVGNTICAGSGLCGHTPTTRCDYTQWCDGLEADSVACVNGGNQWINGECRGPVDTTLCDGPRRECERAGGKFNGSANSGCCIGTCDQCGKLSELVRLKSAQCCNQGLAPPDSVRMCTVESRDKCGVNWSTFQSNDAEFSCQDPSLDSTVAKRYVDNCFEPSSSDSQGGGSSDSGPSSSDGGGVSSPYPEGCNECPYLDSILDTLKLQKKNTDDIMNCLLTPNLCAALNTEDSGRFQIDSALLKYIRPMLDSSVRLDSAQLRALLKLDTNELKRRTLDSLQLRNDTATRQVIIGGFGELDSTTDALNDTTRKWFRRIADSIGVSTDSMAAHLDSILEHIPDSVLDSIIKYQQYATDNFDSVLYGKGKGFSLVDSLIDSTVKYFQKNSLDWQNYFSMYGDSTEIIHEEFIDLPGRNASAIGSALGYGDTASTNLRGDLNAIRGAIERLGDTSGLGGSGGGYGDSVGRYRDSINKYYISDGRFGELVDSTEAAWGVDSLDARWDSSFAYGLCDGDECPPCSDDSCMGSLPSNFVQRADSIARIAGDSLEASTKRQRDSLPTFWDSTFKELRQYSWFGSFDSTFLANIGAKIPNSNTCPEHCFAMDVNGTYAYVGYNMHLDWKLCRPIAPDVLNSLNAFDILKLLARILTVVTCLSILMWEVSSRRGGGIGL